MIELPKQPSNCGLIDLTPLIDIVFIVIVFLLLCMNSAVVELPFSLPKDDQSHLASPEESEELLIKLHAQTPYFEIENQRLNFDALNAAIIDNIDTPNNTQSALSVRIGSDADAPVEPLLKLMTLLNKHHIDNTHILMEKH